MLHVLLGQDTGRTAAIDAFCSSCVSKPCFVSLSKTSQGYLNKQQTFYFIEIMKKKKKTTFCFINLKVLAQAS